MTSQKIRNFSQESLAVLSQWDIVFYITTETNIAHRANHVHFSTNVLTANNQHTQRTNVHQGQMRTNPCIKSDITTDLFNNSTNTNSINTLHHSKPFQQRQYSNSYNQQPLLHQPQQFQQPRFSFNPYSQNNQFGYNQGSHYQQPYNQQSQKSSNSNKN